MSVLNLSLLLVPPVFSSLAIIPLTPHCGAEHFLLHLCGLVGDSFLIRSVSLSHFLLQDSCSHIRSISKTLLDPVFYSLPWNQTQ